MAWLTIFDDNSSDSEKVLVGIKFIMDDLVKILNDNGYKVIKEDKDTSMCHRCSCPKCGYTMGRAEM